MTDKKSGRVVRSPQRRRFLRTALGGAVLFAGGPLAFAAADEAEVVAIVEDLAALQQEQARTLLTVARTLFPHDFLGDSFYAHAVKQLDDMASRDPARATIIRDGLAQLPGNFIDLDTRGREAALGALNAGAFFKLTRRTTVSAVYRNPAVWEHFGYPGPSVAFGGWVNRELVDIDWLPEVTS